MEHPNVASLCDDVFASTSRNQSVLTPFPTSTFDPIRPHAPDLLTGATIYNNIMHQKKYNSDSVDHKVWINNKMI